MRKSIMVVTLSALLGSCSMVFGAAYSDDTEARHVEICIDLTKAWYNAFAASDKQKADSIHIILDKYNNHLVSDNDAIAVIEAN